MPELPEVEHLRRTLEPWLVGARVKGVRLRRKDVLTRSAPSPQPSPAPPKGRGSAALARELLEGDTIVALARHGKNLALIGESGRALGVHLGMSGQMLIVPDKMDRQARKMTHAHCVWEVEREPRLNPRRRSALPRLEQKGEFHLVFRDPRRFGGLWSFASFEELHQARWSGLGPDALTITARELRERLARTARPVKAALLDQTVLAGVGNIYADEALFRAGIDPRSISRAIPAEPVTKLATAIRHTLRQAIGAGGTTIISYVDGQGRSGEFAAQLSVYGRGAEPCTACGRSLTSIIAGGRTTVLCRGCQRVFGR